MLLKSVNQIPILFSDIVSKMSFKYLSLEIIFPLRNLFMFVYFLKIIVKLFILNIVFLIFVSCFPFLFFWKKTLFCVLSYPKKERERSHDDVRSLSLSLSHVEYRFVFYLLNQLNINIYKKDLK